MRMTHPTALVLIALDHGARHGFDIIDATGLTSGTVYPILRRFEDAGLVRSRWEPVERARAEGRPNRRNYTLTAAGRDAVGSALDRYPGLRLMLEAGGGEAWSGA